MRVSFLTPDGELTGELLCDLLALVSVTVTVGQVSAWTRFERIVACDWAIREHLAASDNQIRRRPRPAFLHEPGRP